MKNYDPHNKLIMKRISSVLVLGFIAFLTYGQQDIINENPLSSPEVNPDKTVTFRINAPEAANVSVTGNMDAQNGFANITYDLKKGNDGIWSFTTPVLPSEFYRYAFTVDGVRTIDPGNAYAIRDIGNLTNVFLIGDGLADLYRVNNVPHGTVTYRWYNSPGNNMMRRLVVYTPAGYEDCTREYPVLYLLHGIGGDEESWTGSGRAAEILDNLIAQGKVTAMIVIMTNGNVSMEAAPGKGSKGFDNPTIMLPHTMDGKFEETFMDIMKFVESNYRTINKKEGRAIAGLSMGGFHAANISLFYPDTFDYIGLFSSAPGVRPMGDNSSPVYLNLEEKLKQQMKNGYKLYWMGMGVDDMPMIYKGNEDFRKMMDGLGMKYEYVESEGGHTWNNWRNYLSAFSRKLFREL
jgi:enterochelin esterase family protein